MQYDVSSLSPKEQRELLSLMEEQARRKKRRTLYDYRPYPKQFEFHKLGAAIRERLLMAGNQLGKTLAGAAETSMHLTGKYPDWWQGRRFKEPIRCLAGSESAELTRKGVQRLLVGPPEKEEEWGCGYIPGDEIVGWNRKQGVANALDNVVVKHYTDGVYDGDSVLEFKSYDQGRSKWQADTVHFVWCDEEPPLDVYIEAVTRTNATGGIVMVTFTPLMGMSDVVMRFYPKPATNDIAFIQMTIDDAAHYTPEERARIVAAYPEHEKEARAKGVPVLGSGRVFPIAEERIKCGAFVIPNHWPRICGLDFGWDHPTAAIWLAWDRDADIVYVYDVYAQREQTPVVHAGAIRPRGDWIPVAWPHDGLQHDKGSGEELAQQYRNQAVNMLPERATFEDGSNGLEAGVMAMLDRMKTGRLKVFDHLNEWFDEFRMYHRKDGLIVKERDDRMSATRYGLMMLRFACVEPFDEDRYDDRTGRSSVGGY